MVGVGPLVMVSSSETVDPDIQVAVERECDVRRPERGHDLEPSRFEHLWPVQPQDREVLEPIGGQVVDIGVAASVERRESPPTPVGEPATEVHGLQLRRTVDEIVAAHDDQRVRGQRRSTHSGHPLTHDADPSMGQGQFLATAFPWAEDRGTSWLSRTVAEEVGVDLGRTGDVAHVHDAIACDVDDHDDSADGPGSGDEAGAGNDPRRVGSFVKERPRQAGLVHRVEIERQAVLLGAGDGSCVSEKSSTRWLRAIIWRADQFCRTPEPNRTAPNTTAPSHPPRPSSFGRVPESVQASRSWVAALMTAAVVLVVGACSGDDRSASGSDGEALYKQACASCHGSDLQGTDKGPSHLSQVYEPGHHPDAAFRAAVVSGARAHHWDFGDMAPVPGLTDAEIEAIIGYIREQQEERGFEPHPPR